MQTITQRLAQSDIFGKVNPPPGVAKYAGGDLSGLQIFIGNIVKIIIVVAGLYAFFNLLLAGYQFLSAGDDPKKIEGAWAKIYQSVIGLAVTAGSFVLAGIFGQLLFGDPTFLIRLQIFAPQ